jgi:hypothetical protein
MSTIVKNDKIQTNIGFLFIGIWICALIGFHKTYTVFFPSFKGFRWQHHFHGIMLMSWFAMLIVQPFLIKYEKYSIHRALGKLGYILAPLVCYSIFLVTRMGYNKEIAIRPENIVLGHLALDIPAIVNFGLFFVLAMVNRHKSDVHMRYMIGTSLLMIGPGLGRILIVYFGVPFPTAVTYILFVSEIIAVLFLLNDVRKGANIKPFLTVTTMLIISHVLWATQDSVLWQKFAKWFVETTF